jgi:hypothetical protein
MTVYAAQSVKVKEDGKTYFAPVNRKDLDMLKQRVSEGQLVHAWFSDDEPRGLDQSRLFHKLRDRYAQASGESVVVVKLMLKYTSAPESCRQELGDFHEAPDTPGDIVDIAWLYPGMSSQLVWLKSEAEMTREEEAKLIEQTRMRLQEAGINDEDITE